MVAAGTAPLVASLRRMPCAAGVCARGELCAVGDGQALLRASDALNRESLRLMQHTGFEVDSTKVTVNMGCEQEFFVVDREMQARLGIVIGCGEASLAVPLGHSA